MYISKIVIVRKGILPQLQKLRNSRLIKYKKTPNPYDKPDLDDFIFGNEYYRKHSER